MTRRLWVTLTVIGGAALLTTIVLTVIEGVKYRVREDQGLEPVPAPTWVAVSSYAGLSLFALAAVAIAIIGLVALSRRKSGRSSQ
jgi:hypothetical protein